MIIFFLHKHLLLQNFFDDEGTIIDDILSETCRKTKLPSVDADEDRCLATLVFLSDFLSFLILYDAEFLNPVREKIWAVNSFN
jgi:hypothetical protein